jgi:hypothetical protein
MVLSKGTDLGQFVNPGTQLGVTFATDIAEVRLPLTDQDLAFVDLPRGANLNSPIGDASATVTLTATQKGKLEQWDAHLVRSEGVVDDRSRVTYVVAQLDDPYQLHGDGLSLPIGTFVAADIIGSNAFDVIRIPRISLRGADQVLVVDDENKIDIRTVAVVRSDQKYAYVNDGVFAGERIVTTAIEAPTNGMSVRTAESIAADAAKDSAKVAAKVEGE